MNCPSRLPSPADCGEDVRFQQGLETPLNPGDEVSIVPAVAGG